MSELPVPQIPPGHLFCFGLGYTAFRLALRLIDKGWKVSGTTRSFENAEKLSLAGIKPFLFDGRSPIEASDKIFSDVTHLIASIPPADIGELPLLHHQKDLCSSHKLTWVTYLSTPAVYGDRKGALVSEANEPKPESKRGHRRLAAENAWLKAIQGTKASIQIMRLSGIYGPGRNVIDQVREGRARIIEKPGQVFNRIHVDDIGTILMASMLRPDQGRVYNVADQEACPSGDVVRFACQLIGVHPPDPILFESAELSDMARSFYSECKRLVTNRLKDELMVDLEYPTYREGLKAIYDKQ
jgi:nucleoside-diphosphate-sugar epimerase